MEKLHLEKPQAHLGLLAAAGPEFLFPFNPLNVDPLSKNRAAVNGGPKLEGKTPPSFDRAVISKALIQGELLTWINAPNGDLLL